MVMLFNCSPGITTWQVRLLKSLVRCDAFLQMGAKRSEIQSIHWFETCSHCSQLWSWNITTVIWSVCDPVGTAICGSLLPCGNFPQGNYQIFAHICLTFMLNVYLDVTAAGITEAQTAAVSHLRPPAEVVFSTVKVISLQ